MTGQLADGCVLLCGGGTGGSVTPLLALAAALRRRQPTVKLIFLGTRRGPEQELAAAAGIPFRSLPAGKWRRYFSFWNVIDLARICAGFWQALVLLRRSRPSAVVSAGSFVAVPVIWASWLLRIPSLVHQQDVQPGLANRLVAPFATTISVVFEESVRAYSSRKTVRTGNPVRRELLNGQPEAARRRFRLRPDRPTVLCLGGGTGARSLNRLIAEIVPSLIEQAQFLHVTGRGKMPAVQPRPGYQLVEFLGEELADAYAIADVVISRAGLATLSELALLSKPVVIVPLPGTHQEANAAYFSRRGGALVFSETRGTPDDLLTLVRSLVDSASRRRQLALAIRALAVPDAAERLTDIVIGLQQHVL